MTLEILEWDIAGDTLLKVKFRRRAEFVADESIKVTKDENGVPTIAVNEKGIATRLSNPAGQVVSLSLHKDDIDAGKWALLTMTYATIMNEIQSIAETAYTAAIESPKTLDTKIQAAEQAKLDVAKSVGLMAALRTETNALELKKTQLIRETVIHENAAAIAEAKAKKAAEKTNPRIGPKEGT